VTVGLGGGDVAVERVEVRWPSGIVQALLGPAIDRVHVITEAAGDGAPPALTAAAPAPGSPSTAAAPRGTADGGGTPEAEAEIRPRVELPAAEILARADALARRHRVAEALEVIRAHRPAPPDGTAGAEDAAALLALREQEARLLVNLSRPREAAAILEALRSDGLAGESAVRWLARAYVDAGEHARAVAVFESLARETLRQELLGYGRALAGAGRLEDGAEALAACLVRDPWLDPALLELGRTLVRLGRARAGRVFLDVYERTAPRRSAEQEALAREAGGEQAAALHRRALAERERGRLFEAWKLESEAVRLDAALGDAYLALARIWLFLARPLDAIELLEKLPAEPRVPRLLEEARAAAAETGTPFARVRERMAGKPLAECGPDLLGLLSAYEGAGRAEDARTLALFLFKLAPGSAAAGGVVVRLFDRPEDVFTRLWAIAALEDAGAADAGLRRRFDGEMAALGVDAGRVRAWAAP
jgi:tetratricopeptide (TPR) repeat protein